MTTTNATLNTILATLNADLAAWEQVQADRSSGHTFLSGTPYVVAQADCSLAIRIDGFAAIPVSAKPSVSGSIIGCSEMTRKDAERIAALRGCGYVVVPVREIPTRRIAALRQMIAEFENMGA